MCETVGIRNRETKISQGKNKEKEHKNDRKPSVGQALAVQSVGFADM